MMSSKADGLSRGFLLISLKNAYDDVNTNKYSFDIDTQKQDALLITHIYKQTLNFHLFFSPQFRQPRMDTGGW